MRSHDVCFVNCCDLASTYLSGVVKGKLGDASRLLSGDDLQTFDHTGHTLQTLTRCWF